MLLTPPTHSEPSLMLIEACLTVSAGVFAFGWPRIGFNFFGRVERGFGRLARRKGLAVLSVGLTALLLRLALLPVCPIPHPFTPDDFSFLLASDTFEHARLTNPTPPMWIHFETVHITMQPSYMSMYFPAQGLFMAAGKVLFGDPWFGILVSSALMCAALCWMLQAWMPPTWALLGGLLAVLRLGLFSYWINSYTGAGCITALGGALILGALPRMMKAPQLRHGQRYGLLMALGIGLLVLSRPFEGMLLCLPVAFVLGRWILRGKNRPNPKLLARCAALPLLVVVASISWLGYYDYRNFGSPATLPYTVDRATYAMAPYYVWQSPRPEPVYHHEVLRQFYEQDELDFFNKIHSLSGYIPQSLSKAHDSILFLAGVALLPPLFMMRRVILDMRVRFLVICLAIYTVGMAAEIYIIPHYLGPFIAVFYALGLQAMRHLRLWRVDGRRAGLATVRLLITICVLLGGVRVFAGSLHLIPQEWPPYDWLWQWYGPGYYGGQRAAIESKLEQLPGKQLVIVRYDSKSDPIDEWVYNEANIEDSKVIWAQEMDGARNQELFHFYKDREVWLVRPDTHAVNLTPYSVAGPLATPAH